MEVDLGVYENQEPTLVHTHSLSHSHLDTDLETPPTSIILCLKETGEPGKKKKKTWTRENMQNPKQTVTREP